MPGSILEVADYHGPYAGSFIPSMLAVADAAREQLALDTVFVLPEAVRNYAWVNDVRGRGYEPYFLARGSVRSEAQDLYDIAQRHHAVLAHSHFTRHDIPAGLAIRANNGRSIWHAHNRGRASGLKRDLSNVVKARVLHPLCQRVIACSDEVGREEVARGFNGRVRVVRNGIDTTRFAEMPLRGQARRKLGLGDERVALAFCWDPYRKGADVIASAMAKTANNVTVVMVGDDRLRTFLKANGYAGNVRVVDPVPDARWLYAAADVFVSGSRSEGFPYAIGEAMAAGLPVISSDIPEVEAYLDAPGMWGYHVEDEQALTQLMDREPSGGALNRCYVASYHSLDRYVDEVCALFADLLHLVPTLAQRGARR